MDYFFVTDSKGLYLNHFDVIVPQSCQIRYNNAKKTIITQGGHSPGKPGKVREFQTGQGKLRENGKKVRETEICFSIQLTYQ